VNDTSERGPSEPEGSPLDDRLIAALTSVSSHIDVTPRAFEPPAARRPRQNADPIRKPMRLVAVAALIVGVTGMVVMSRTPADDDVVVTGLLSDEDGPPFGYEAPVDGTFDPKFLDYVAPINGDDGRSAERLFVDGYSRARAKSITDCLEESGLSDAEASWAVAMTDWYSFHESSAQARLPALRTVAEQGLDRPRPGVVSQNVSSTVDRCRETDASKASRWQRDIEPLQKEFAASVDEVIATVEAGPMWNELRGCLIRSGAPANDENGLPHAHIEGYLDWLSAEQASSSSVGSVPPGTTASGARDGGGSPASRAFARCAEPFYAAVEMTLAERRDAFVAKHRRELLDLQAEFASFA
jgi:hypothetical protein